MSSLNLVLLFALSLRWCLSCLLVYLKFFTESWICSISNRYWRKQSFCILFFHTEHFIFLFCWSIIKIQECISLGHTGKWLDLHILWNNYHNKFSYHWSFIYLQTQKDKQAFTVRIYAHLIRTCAVFNVFCAHRWQRLYIPLMSYLALGLTLSFPKYFLSILCVSLLF